MINPFIIQFFFMPRTTNNTRVLRVIDTQKTGMHIIITNNYRYIGM